MPRLPARVAAAEPWRPLTAANWGARAAAGSGETRASYAHAAAATSPMVAHRDTDLTSDIGCLRARGGRETWRRFAGSASRILHAVAAMSGPRQDRGGEVTSLRKKSRTP